MTRPKRINLPFTFYHILSRTNTGDIAFPDQEDEQKFLFYLGKYVTVFSFKIHGVSWEHIFIFSWKVPIGRTFPNSCDAFLRLTQSIITVVIKK